MTADLTQWLTEDARIDLAADPLGLYELMWSLHAKDPALDTSERRRIARAALDNLLADQRYHFVRRHWTSKENVRLPADYEASDSDFDDIPEDGWYVALDVT